MINLCFLRWMNLFDMNLHVHLVYWQCIPGSGVLESRVEGFTHRSLNYPPEIHTPKLPPIHVGTGLPPSQKCHFSHLKNLLKWSFFFLCIPLLWEVECFCVLAMWYSFLHARAGDVFCPRGCGQEKMIRSRKNIRLCNYSLVLGARPSVFPYWTWFQ